MTTDQWWIAILVGLGCMTPFCVQATTFLRNQRRHGSWARTVAVVLHTTVSTSSDNVRSYRASYNYMDATGAARFGRGEVDRQLANGAELPILFDPEDPARSQPQRRVHVGHWIAGTLGFLLFLGGLFGVAQGIHILVTGEMMD